jgi:hypothetical protein
MYPKHCGYAIDKTVSVSDSALKLAKTTNFDLKVGNLISTMGEKISSGLPHDAIKTKQKMVLIYFINFILK